MGDCFPPRSKRRSAHELSSQPRHLGARRAQQRPPSPGRGPARLRPDCRPDNMLIGPDRNVILVDWAFALHSAAPWLDAAFLAPQLVVAGWDPAAAIQALEAHPVMDRADRGYVAVFWAALVGYWQRSCRLEAPVGVPGIRPYQRAAAEAGVRILQLFIDD